MENYFIKDGYSPLPFADSIETHVGDYWTTRRMRLAMSYQWPVYRHALSLADERRAGIVVDIGCGTGVKLNRIHALRPQLELFGYDQPTVISVADKIRPWDGWRPIDLADERTFDDGIAGDIVICADVIEHVLDPDKVLKAIRAKLAPKGLAIVSTPERDRLRGKANLRSPLNVHIREWNAAEFRAYIENRGFEILDHIFLLPGTPLLSPEIWMVLAMQAAMFRPLRYNQALVIRPR